MKAQELADEIGWTAAEVESLLAIEFPEVKKTIPKHICLALMCLADIKAGAEKLEKVFRFGGTDMLGRKFTNKQGLTYEVVDRVTLDVYEVDFGDYKTQTRRSNIVNGLVRNPMYKSAYGVGCIGDGGFNSSDIRYRVWRSLMLKASRGQPVDTRFMNFQNYCKLNPL